MELKSGQGQKLPCNLAPTTLPHIERDDVEPDPGLDIHTTLDIDLQDFADATLRKSLEEYDAKNGCVVLMEVKTGNVLTMVNLERNGEGEYELADESEIARECLDEGYAEGA